jgi:flagellar biosynthesis protein FliQ
MENFQEAIGALVLMSGVVIIIYIIARYTYLVKKAMIENGHVSPSKSSKLIFIDYGCIVGGIGVGLIISSIFTLTDMKEDTMDLLVWGTILIFGALGLILAQFLRSKLGDQR